jgi:hypothetical protein
MFRTSWFHPQGDRCICGMEYFTCIGVRCVVERRVFTTLSTPMHVKHFILHTQLSPEDETKKFETYSRQQKLKIKY